MPTSPGNREAVRSPGTRTWEKEEAEEEEEVEVEEEEKLLCLPWCRGLLSPQRRANRETSSSLKVLEVVRRDLWLFLLVRSCRGLMRGECELGGERGPRRRTKRK